MTRWNAPGRARPDEPLAIWCEAGIDGVCTGRAEVRHHIIRRGPGSSDEAWNTLDLCETGCHRYIHANITWAKSRGFLRSRPPVQTMLDVAHAAVSVLQTPPVDDGLCPGIGEPLGDTLPDGRRVCMGCGHGFHLIPCASGWGGGVLPDHTRELAS